MDPTIKNSVLLIFICVMFSFISCTNTLSESSTQDGAGVSLVLHAPETHTNPEKVIVNVNVEDNFSDAKETNWGNQGGITFTKLPLGMAWINVDVFDNAMVKLFDGSFHLELRAGDNDIKVPLNNVILSYFINDAMENTFLQNSTDKSDFWNVNYDKSLIQMNKNNPNVMVQVRAAFSNNAYYFLFEINDDDFISGDVNDKNQNGEWENDAAVIYIAKKLPTDDAEFSNQGNRTYLRIMCMVGDDPTDNGIVKITSFTGTQGSMVHEGPLVDYQNAHVSQPEANRRIFEIKINKNLLTIGGDPGNRIAFVARYTNNNQNTNPEILSWKNQFQDPKVDVNPWGNLELKQ